MVGKTCFNNPMALYLSLARDDRFDFGALIAGDEQLQRMAFTSKKLGRTLRTSPLRKKRRKKMKENKMKKVTPNLGGKYYFWLHYRNIIMIMIMIMISAAVDRGQPRSMGAQGNSLACPLRKLNNSGWSMRRGACTFWVLSRSSWLLAQTFPSRLCWT